MQTIQKKLKTLEHILQDMQGVMVAFSGGVDSTFLLNIAHNVLGDNAYAVTAQSPTFPAHEFKQAKEYARSLGVNYRIIKTDELSSEKYLY